MPAPQSDLRLLPYSPKRYRVDHSDGSRGDCFYWSVINALRNTSTPVPSDPAGLRYAIAQATSRPDVKRRALGGEWAEQEEVDACAELLKVCIAVWSTTFDSWIVSFPKGINQTVRRCPTIVFVINVGGRRPETDILAVDDPQAPTGLHFDRLVPLVPHEALFESGAQGEAEEGEGSSDEGEGSSDEELPLDPENMIAMLDDDDDDDDGAGDHPEESDDAARRRFEKLSLAARYDRVRELLALFERGASDRVRASAQSELLALRPDGAARDRLEDVREYALSLEPGAEAESSSFELTDNQRFLKKFLSPATRNRALLLFHGVGVGKTCAAVQIGVNFEHYFEKRVLVVLPSALETNFRKELFNIDAVDFERRTYTNCYGQAYLDRIPSWHTMSPTRLNKAVQAIINRQFEFMGFMRFVNVVHTIVVRARNAHRLKESVRQDVRARIDERFSHRVIVIDEVHNIRLGDDDRGAVGKLFPSALRAVMRDAVGIRMVAMSATPMFDRAEELEWIMTVLRACDHAPNREKVEFDASGELLPRTRDTLAHFARNYVSYMRGQDPDTFPARFHFVDDAIAPHPSFAIDGATKIAPVKTPLVSAPMKGVQLRAYNAMLKDPARTKTRMQEISNVVFRTDAGEPLFGRPGFDATFSIRRHQGRATLAYTDGATPLKGAPLAQSSSKIAAILRHIKEAEGIVLVYSQYLYYGLLPMAVALEHAGYRRSGGALVPELEPERRREDRSNGEYVLVSGAQDFSPQVDADIRALNHPSNADGSRIKVVLVSQIATEGFDLKCVREVHVMEPWYNVNRIEQVIGRAERFRSHDRLPPEKRNFTVYRYASTVPRSKVESVDYRFYRISERKAERVRQVVEILASNAVDCPLNEARHNRPSPKHALVDAKGRERSREEVPRAPTMRCRASATKALRDIDSARTVTMEDVITVAKRLVRLAQARERVYWSRGDMLREPLFAGRERLLRHALQWLTLTRYPVHIAGERGTVAPFGDVFLFQPDSVQDTKITLRDRLQSDVLRVQHLSVDDAGAETAEREAPVDAPVLDVEKRIRERRVDLRKRIGPYLSHTSDPSVDQDQIITDMVVDRLSSDELRAVVANHRTVDEYVRRSLHAAHVLMEGESAAYFDPRAATFRKSSDGSACNLVENDRLTRLLRKRLLASDGDESGFIRHDAKHGTYFAMKNPAKPSTVKQTGTSCLRTSSIKKPDLVQFVGKILPVTSQVAVNAMRNKGDWCDLYEYALRLKRSLARPVSNVVQKN